MFVQFHICPIYCEVYAFFLYNSDFGYDGVNFCVHVIELQIYVMSCVHPFLFL